MNYLKSFEKWSGIQTLDDGLLGLAAKLIESSTSEAMVQNEPLVLFRTIGQNRIGTVYQKHNLFSYGRLPMQVTQASILKKVSIH